MKMHRSVLFALATAVAACGAEAKEHDNHGHQHELKKAPVTAQDAAGASAVQTTDFEASIANFRAQLAKLNKGKGNGAGNSTATATGPDLKLRVLVLSADGNEANLPAIQQALDYVGQPYTVWIASQKQGQLTAAALATNGVGNYAAVMVTDASLGYWNGSAWASALSTDEWTALNTYEATYHVRQINWYAWPTPDLGFVGSPTAMDTTNAPLSWQLTGTAAPLFPYMSGTAPIKNAYVYLDYADTTSSPLMVDGDGHALAVMKTWADGREAITMTFDSAPWLMHAQILSYGLVNWAMHGVFIGERREYLATQIDDVFLDSDIYTGGTYRITGNDLQGIADWQKSWANSGYMPGFNLDMYFNGEGTLATEWDFTDTLTPKAKALQAQFKWGSHTYTHQNLDATTYNQTYTELSKNVNVAKNMGFTTFTKANLVQPEVSGLTNPTALQAMADFGIRYVVADTSKPGQSAGPNLGIYNAYQPSILEIPRFPTNLYYNVSNPQEWTTEYNDIYRGYWGRDLSYDEILDKESDVMLSYLLKGAANPLMFHQANLRMYDGTHSTLGDLVDRTMEKYLALYNLPVRSFSMDQLAAKFATRMKMAAANLDATLRPGVSVTVKGTAAATVTVTGVCTGTVERYGGQCTASIPIAANTAKTVLLN